MSAALETEGVSSPIIDQPGLVRDFEKTTFSLRPLWTINPDVEMIRKIVRSKLGIQKEEMCDIEFLAIHTLGEHTIISVPRIIKYNFIFNNTLGFEWMLMKYVTGKSFEMWWHEISWLKKGNADTQHHLLVISTVPETT
ncbi:hypothetical protein BS50DRAFT_656666 [Corynespora cassiicola Philippines]|uniref:Uncharacterized protein n=1 Tax=Corynespora cassiicola Philippines TaxID=1448308 RepID=A0A2T2N2S4_CORCC|nr:hypothetical protein BS50DRAFT_656666 [Corynespora cassiicola Philippines]